MSNYFRIKNINISLVFYIFIIQFGIFFSCFASAEKGGVKSLLSDSPSAGSVDTFKENQNSKTSTVIAKGLSPIYNGNIQDAKNAALRMAYSEAISQVCGVEIGSWTLIRNAKHVNDIVLSKSRGFIKSYTIISEGIGQTNNKQYVVEIEANVIERGSAGQKSIHGLNLYLRLLGDPKVLIILPSQETRPSQDTRKRDTGKQFRGTEAALAQALSKYRYQTVTSDDLTGKSLASKDILQEARSGASAQILHIAREIGADIVISGLVHLSTQTFEPLSSGKKMSRVSAEVSTKALIVSSGKHIAARHFVLQKTGFDQLSASSRCLDAIAEQIADAFAWKIPKILVESNRETQLVIHNINVKQVHDIKNVLTTIGFDAAQVRRLPTQSKKSAKLTLLSSFSRPDNNLIYQACKKAVSKIIQIDKSNKYSMEISLHTPKAPKPEPDLDPVVPDGRFVVAILNFNSMGGKAEDNSLGRLVSENLANLAVSKKIFDIVERERLKEVLDEQDIGQPAGEFDNQLLEKINDLTGANAVFTGTVIKMGNKLDITVRMIDIKTALTIASANEISQSNISSVKHAVKEILSEIKRQAYTQPKN
ncbi:MAG: CsgG/HfaB family protein [Desulfovermiculus sp.]|nr:CsgG/HfaB family protein [Desulfovermiculus sp.]